MPETTRITMLDELRATHSSERWVEFFDEYGELLRRWLIAHRVNKIDAEDIQQETMVTVLNQLPTFIHNGRAGAFRLWLKRILTNRMRRVFDKRAARKEESNLDELASTLADDGTLVSLEFQKEHEQFLIRQLLQRAESQFEPERIRMFRELVIDGVPIESLVDKYQMTSGAIRVQQHRILKWLKSAGEGLVEV